MIININNQTNICQQLKKWRWHTPRNVGLGLEDGIGGIVKEIDEIDTSFRRRFCFKSVIFII
jgi:hypothetical protein